MMQLTAYHLATLVAAAALLILSAVNDARHYRIPNRMCLALLMLFPVYSYTAPHTIDWKQHAIVALLVLICGFVMFMGNLAGAGDIKLITVTSLFAGPHFIAVFIVTTALAGGIVALIMAGLAYRRHQSSQPVSLAKVPIPYGIAIAFGGIYTFGMIARPLVFPS